MKQHIANHWHHHASALAILAVILSFFLGAGTTVRFIRKGGYQPGPLPPTMKVQKIAGGIPARHSLVPFVVRIHNQGASNSCVGQTVSTIKEMTVKGHRLHSRDPHLRSHDAVWFSPGYVYDQANGGQDAGSSYQDAFEILRNQGDATYKRFPHDGIDWWAQPDYFARKNAAHYRITTWRSIAPSERYTISYEIAHARPVAVAIPVDDIFYNQWLSPSVPTVSYWDGTWKFWHSMTPVAYGPRGLTLLNSWGPQYGHRGLVRVTWSYLAGINQGGVHAQVVVSTPQFPRAHLPAPPPPPTLPGADGGVR